MTVTSHAELLDAIQNHLHEDTTSMPDARVDEFLDLAEARIRNDVRNRYMESESSITLSSGTRTVALPTNYIGHRRLYINTDPVKEVRYVTPEHYWATWMSSQTDEPDEFTVEAGNYVFGPVPGSAYTGQALIYALAPLTSSVTPSLLTNHPDIYFYATLVEASTFAGSPNEEVLFWEAKYRAAVDGAMKREQHDRYPGPLIRRRIGSVP